ncbi:MAG TPA: SIMPL domain-containing protein [Blastocatellia bacterium]|nr:SIMPL domain-containing protein [Blastocatellia bacterium]
MDGQRNGYFMNAGVALAIGLVLSSIIFGWFFASSRKGDEAITVTGSAKRRIKSDLVIWSAGVSYQASQLADAYRELSTNIPKIKQYLASKGVAEAQMTVSAISSTTLYERDSNGRETSQISGYTLRQDISVRSNEVDKIAQIAREATELINQGILLESRSPEYYYTEIGDLKIEMLGEAAKDAKTRAERIAASTGNSIGSVRSARMGVLQITAADSTEVSDYGIFDTSTIDKDMTAVVNVSFAVN